MVMMMMIMMVVVIRIMMVTTKMVVMAIMTMTMIMKATTMSSAGCMEGRVQYDSLFRTIGGTFEGDTIIREKLFSICGERGKI